MLLLLLSMALLALSSVQGNEDGIVSEDFLEGSEAHSEEEEIPQLLTDGLVEEVPEESQGRLGGLRGKKGKNGRKGHGQQYRPCSQNVQGGQKNSPSRGDRDGRGGQRGSDHEGGQGSQGSHGGRRGQGAPGGQRGQHGRGGQGGQHSGQ
nr:mesenchyme-specific cell surface glycoprotein-like [Equus asinus]